MKRWLFVIVAIVVGGLGLIAYLAHDWYHGALLPADPAGKPKIVRIPEGASVDQIAEILHQETVIIDTRAFKIMLRMEGLADRLKAGIFEISPLMTAQEVAEHIASGEIAMQRLTIPEGLRLTQIAERVGRAELADAEEFMAAAVSDVVVGQVETQMPLPEGTLEGYLFPETYDFPYDAGPEVIVRRMVREMEKRFYLPHREEIESRGLTFHEIVTLASLIEREARLDRERALISGVIQNRLNRGMKLQIDATVQYALPEHKERLLYADLRVESPYNTYRHAGLPPGPIASPGLASLTAALRPAQTDALFYVARTDGSHVFTPSYQDHLRAIERIRGR